MNIVYSWVYCPDIKIPLCVSNGQGKDKHIQTIRYKHVFIRLNE